MSRPNLYSAAEAAKLLNVNSSTIRRACAKHGIGKQLPYWVLTEADVKKLKKIVRDAPGNPNFGKKD